VNRIRAEKADATTIVVEVMRGGESSAVLQDLGCIAISSLTQGIRLTRVGNSGTIEAVVSTMNKHTVNIKLQYSACFALLVLILDNEDNVS
jgi:hypothetical protein